MQGRFQHGQVPFAGESLVLEVVRLRDAELLHRAAVLEDEDAAHRLFPARDPDAVLGEVGERAVRPFKRIAQHGVTLRLGGAGIVQRPRAGDGTDQRQDKE